jgi:hypothetical protein
MAIGVPLTVPAEATDSQLEDARLELEQRLTHLEIRARQLLE